MPLRVLFFFTMFSLGIVWSFVHGAFVRRLREHHEDLWQQLGAPRTSFDVSASTVYRFLQLLFTRAYRKAGDHKLAVVGDWLFVIVLGIVGSVAAMLLVPENSYIPLP